MYRIGEFSILSKTTIKTLRYYEKEGLLIPSSIDKFTNYRFYDTKQLLDLSKIISLRQIGLSIDNIKSILSGGDMNSILSARKDELDSLISISNDQLSRINYLMEEKNMEKKIIIKELPDCTVYYMEGVIENFSKITEFILKSAEECKKINPNIKCLEPDYCYINYLDGEYKDHNISIRYAQAVTEVGNENDIIKFEQLNPIEAACIYHRGAYDNLGESYSAIIKFVQDNGYRIAAPIRERYIDGIWNKDNVDDWLTEIQVPIER